MICLNVILLFSIFNIERINAITIASSVIDTNTEIEMQNLLIEFMTDLKKFSFDKFDHHRLMVLGKNGDLLRATQVLLESGIPYFISTGAEATVFPLHFGADSAVLFFIDGYSDSELNSTFDKLPNDYRCKSLLISVERNRTVESIAATLASAFKMKLNNVLFAHYDGQVIEIYGRVLNANCREEITLLNTWIPKEGFRKEEYILGYPKASLNHPGCPIFVSTFQLSPTMMLREDENKSMHIRGGVEGRLIQTIVEHLNMVPVLKVPSEKEQFWVMPDGTVSGIVGNVVRDLASIGIGRILPTLKRTELADFTVSYGHECVTWTVPFKTKYNYNVVISEFSSTTWMMVILSVLLCCILVYTIPKLNIGYRSSLNTFDVISMTLNYAIPRNPSGVLCKVFFLLYLHYSRVLSTAYSASLSSILTTTTPESAIVDEEGIITAGLRTAGTLSSLAVLKDQISLNSNRAELINRYEVVTSVEAALARITDRQDMAYLRHFSEIRHAAKQLLIKGKPLKFYSLSGCVLSYYPVIVTRKGSRLTVQINNILLRLLDAGMTTHWNSLDHGSESQVKKSRSDHRTLFRLRSIFILYLCCLVPAFLVFIAELIVFKLKIGWFTR